MAPTTPTRKGPTKKSASLPKSPAKSPARKKGPVKLVKEVIKNKNKPKAVPTVTCYTPHSILEKEIYTFTMAPADGTESVADGFTHSYKRYWQGELEVDALTEANFGPFKFRRRPNSNNEIMLDPKEYWRCVFLRTPLEGVSTPETRAEGLQVLRTFLMSSDYSDYPPKQIDVLDTTDDEFPVALDCFLQDHDIVEIVKDTHEESELNENFYENYQDFARLIWSHRFYPQFARGLGFP